MLCFLRALTKTRRQGALGGRPADAGVRAPCRRVFVRPGGRERGRARWSLRSALARLPETLWSPWKRSWMP